MYKALRNIVTIVATITLIRLLVMFFPYASSLQSWISYYYMGSIHFCLGVFMMLKAEKRKDYWILSITVPIAAVAEFGAGYCLTNSILELASACVCITNVALTFSSIFLMYIIIKGRANKK